jgi:hypothetical protein
MHGGDNTAGLLGGHTCELSPGKCRRSWARPVGVPFVGLITRTHARPLSHSLSNLLVKLLQCKWAQVRCGKGETGVVNSGSVIELIKK